MFFSVLIWVQTVCKGYQQTTKCSLVNSSNRCINDININHLKSAEFKITDNESAQFKLTDNVVAYLSQ